MKSIDLAKAKRYLSKLGLEKKIWDIKQDILGGKLHAKKSGVRYWVTETDLDNAYRYTGEKIGGREYNILRKEGWTKEEIIERILIPQCKGDKTKAMNKAKAFEANITMGTYDKKDEKYGDIEPQYLTLNERAKLLKEFRKKEI